MREEERETFSSSCFSSRTWSLSSFFLKHLLCTLSFFWSDPSSLLSFAWSSFTQVFLYFFLESSLILFVNLSFLSFSRHRKRQWNMYRVNDDDDEDAHEEAKVLHFFPLLLSCLVFVSILWFDFLFRPLYSSSCSNFCSQVSVLFLKDMMRERDFLLRLTMDVELKKRLHLTFSLDLFP